MSKILMNYDLVVVQDEDRQFASKPGYGSKYASALVREMGFMPKLHTIRENYDLWARRAEKINRGEAVLSIRQWTGSAYNFKRDGSKQVEILRLEKIGVQKISIQRIPIVSGAKQKFISIVAGGLTVPVDIVAKNDGLSDEDFYNWFKKDVEGCVIHFTDFKY